MLINKTKYTPSQVKGIIDFNLQESKSFMFVCDFSLAHYIYDYLHNDYGIVATAIELSSDINEYYVSLQFYPDGNMDFVCEFSKGEDDDYKYDESDNVDYYVFSDMAFGDVREYLTGKGELDFCELVDEDCVEELLEIHCNDCDCKDGSACDGCGREVKDGNMMDDKYLDEDVCSVCGEVDCDCGECMCDDCRSQRHDDIVNASVGKAFEKIMKSEGCPNCIVDALFEMSLEMKRLGWNDHRSYIDECNC